MPIATGRSTGRKRCRGLLALLESEKSNIDDLQGGLARLRSQLDRERQRKSRLLDLYADGQLNKPALTVKMNQVTLKLSKLDGQILEAQQHLDMVEGKKQEALTLQADIKALRAEGVRRVAGVLEKLSNNDKKAFPRAVIEGRLQLDQDCKPLGHMNLSAGYEYLGHFLTSPA